MATENKTPELFDTEADYGVRITNNYKKFKVLDGNREVNRIGFIKKNIKKYGYLRMPILVNEDHEVIEGQHRLAACEELGVPVHYIVQEGLGIDHCIALNVGRRNWAIKDYVHSKSSTNVDFSYFEILLRKYPAFGLRIISATYDGTVTGGGASEAVKNGKLRCSEEDFNKADRTLSWLSGFLEDIKASKISGTKNNLYLALIFAYNSPKISKPLLTKRVHDNFRLFGRSIGAIEDAIMKLEDIYNYKVPASNRTDLLSEYRNAVRESSGNWKGLRR